MHIEVLAVRAPGPLVAPADRQVHGGQREGAIPHLVSRVALVACALREGVGQEGLGVRRIGLDLEDGVPEALPAVPHRRQGHLAGTRRPALRVVHLPVLRLRAVGVAAPAEAPLQCDVGVVPTRLGAPCGVRHAIEGYVCVEVALDVVHEAPNPFELDDNGHNVGLLSARLVRRNQLDIVCARQLVAEEQDAEAWPRQRVDGVVGVRAGDLEGAARELVLLLLVALVELAAVAVANPEVADTAELQCPQVEVLLGENADGQGPVCPRGAGDIGRELIINAARAANHRLSARLHARKGDVVLRGKSVASDRQAAVQTVDTSEKLCRRRGPERAHDRTNPLVPPVDDEQVLPCGIKCELRRRIHGARPRGLPVAEELRIGLATGGEG
mmetsp:Transcript_15367/g.44396  ORF Transcript_15367/g.44396 Transcript_15367/m.44396 type:complete len:385 (-) Transcript_15367:1478-2632(-)